MSRYYAPLGGVRRSQLITTYGVGALIAVGDQSFMIMGLDRWPTERADEIHEPLLERALEVERFLLPPAGEMTRDVPVIRFPTWSSCPSCRRLDRHSFFSTFTKNECSRCKMPLVTSRFVVVCENGHIDDFPYFEWVHASSGPGTGNRHELTIDARGVSASLRDIVIECSCGKSRSMHSAFARDALKDISRCKGRSPWLGRQEECDRTPRTLQRGASNVYFSVVRSAISIPPWSEGVFKVLNHNWTLLRGIKETALSDVIEGIPEDKRGGYSVDDLIAAVRMRKARETDPGAANERIRDQEYVALQRGAPEKSRDQDFVAERIVGHEPWINGFFERITAVSRLREVRALEGFTRLTPLATEEESERIAGLSASETDWLPAVEVLGEGVFLDLSRERLAEWDTQAEVRSRAARINDLYIQRSLAFGVAVDREITAREILIHTLAHILIDQWALDSGYPAAGLRERLYISGDMNGLLIYTGTSDSAGSLGGVISQADPGRLERSLVDAVRRAAWCSADPLCIEADAAGVDALNLAACHACVLLPEVSCERGNVLLDRALLIGTPERVETGFFAALLDGA